MSKKFIPTGSRILVEVVVTNTTESGLYVPTSPSVSRRARVVSVSTTWNPKDQDPVAYVGQTVVLDRIGGVEVEVDGKKLLLVRNDEILGVEVNEPVEIPF